MSASGLLGSEDCDYDIAIVGGGLVGASLAAALAHSSWRVLLLEAQTPPASEARWDERCIALNDGSRRILDGLGLWAALAAQAEPIVATHISERGRFGVSRFHADDAGLSALGYNTPLRALGAVLSARLAAQANLRLAYGQKLTQIAVQPEVVQLEVQGAALSTTSYTARLVVACDGAGSAVRQMLGGEAEVRDYAQSAIVTAVTTERSLQGIAYERFLPTGPLALLPKPRLPGDERAGHIASLVWTLPTAEAAAHHATADADFLAAAQDAFGERVGKFLTVGARVSWPLARTINQMPMAPRLLFCGNAAQSLHPVAAQGFNLGLRDVAVLAQLLESQVTNTGVRADPGAGALLQQFTQARAPDREQTAGFTDTLVRSFSNRLPLLSQLRPLGLLAVDLLPPIKQAVLRQNLGHTGLGR